MAVTRTENKTELKIVIENGYTDSGTEKKKTLTIKNINPELADADLLSIGRKLGDLQSHSVLSINRAESATLTEEPE